MALWVIDEQNKYFMGMFPITYPSGSLENIPTAMDAATSQGIPVIIVRHTDPMRVQPLSEREMMSRSFAKRLHPAITTT